VLDGSVLRDGGRLRINARLNDVGKQQTLWSQSFDRDLGEQLQLEDEIAGQVAAALRQRFLPARGGQRMIDPSVYDLYLQGRGATRIHSPESIRHGQDLLRAAVQRAPDFPQVWYELANNYLRSGQLEPLAEQERSFALGREAARRAQALDPAYGAAFGIEQMLERRYGRWAGIDAGLTRALALAPNDADTLLWRGINLCVTGRVKAGLPFLRRANSLNPLEQFTLNSVANSVTWAGLFDEAEQFCDRIAVILPRTLSSYWTRVWLLITARRDREAIAWLHNDVQKVPGDPTDEYNVLSRGVQAASGDAAAKRASAQELVALGRLGLGYAGNSLIMLALLQQWDLAADMAHGLYLRTGPIKVDQSQEFLSNSRYRPFQEPDPRYLFHPFLKPLRASGRLNAEFDAIGLTAYWAKNGPPDP